MNGTLKLIRELVGKTDVVISVHGYEELANDDIDSTGLATQELIPKIFELTLEVVDRG